VRLPAALPEGAVNRVVCEGCRQEYGPQSAASGPQTDAAPAARPALGAGLWARTEGARIRLVQRAESARLRLADGAGGIRDRLPSRDELPPLPLPAISKNRMWAWASVPLALLGVIAGLALIQDGSSGQVGAAEPSAAEQAASEATFISEPGYSLALPTGWEQTTAPEGATFRAESVDGMADATLWIEKNPNLGFKQFERRSLTQLTELSPDAKVVDRVEGPTIETTISELRAEPMTNGVAAPYRVTLRGAGPYRLYFATAEQPAAKPKLRGDIELMHGSLRPDVALEGVDG
jgi:hypothetical protein